MDAGKAFMQSLIDAHDNPFVVIDGDYRIRAANRAYREAYGVREEDVVGRKCHEVSHHSAVPCHENGEDCPHRRVFGGSEPYQTLHVHYDRHNHPEHVRLKGVPLVGPQGEALLGEAIFPLGATPEIDCDQMRMIGRAPAFLVVMEALSRAAKSDAAVLLFGESGTGKELAAHYIHQQSARRGGPFHTLDCTAIPEALFESELFGHERGAFTGCVGRKRGLFELAHGGTLFMDEIGEIPLAMQAKLLRVLEAGEFRRVGGTETLKADVRIVSATNRDLLQMAGAGGFRRDLFYRISVIDVTLPPLRERRVDIPILAETLLARVRGPKPCRLSPDALARLIAYDYPGNIRELRNLLTRAAALCSNGLIEPEHLPIDAPAGSPRSSRRPGADEKTRIESLLASHQGHRRRVAEALGISERTLYRKLARYGLSE